MATNLSTKSENFSFSRHCTPPDVDNALAVEAWTVRMCNERDQGVSESPQDSFKKAAHEGLYQKSFRELEEAQDEYSQCVSFRATQYETLNDLEREANKNVTPPPPPEDRVQAAVRLKPDRRFCGVPLAIAKQLGCTASDAYIRNEIERQEVRETIHQNALKSIEGQKEKIRAIDARIDAVKKETEELKRKCEDARSARDEFIAELSKRNEERRQTYSDAMTSVRRYGEDKQKLQSLQNDIESKKTKRKELSGKLTALRKSREKSGDVSDYFLHVVQYVIGEKVWGKVLVDRELIGLECTYNDAKYNSAALDAAYNVMFDLTVLVMAIQGKSTHPRFLLHDGPRVADISPAIYSRYFEFAEDLERRAAGKPNFQYIITTTEPPPIRYRENPFMVLKLDASVSEGRLLKCDLRG